MTDSPADDVTATAAAYEAHPDRFVPKYREAADGVWCSASFLHVPREDADATLAEFARVLGDDGALFLSVMAREPREVDAAEVDDGRRFTFWREDDLRERLGDVGFRIDWDSGQEDWHAVVAVRE